MKNQVDSRLFAVVIDALIKHSDAKSAVKFIDAKTVVRATWRNKPKARNYMESMVVSYGQPNYLERAFIARAASLPRAVQFRPWPKPRAKK